MKKLICYTIAATGGTGITALVMLAIQYGSILTVGL